MIITWVFLASTGIVVARYFKFMFPEVKINNVDFWFFIHQPVMFSVPIISIVAFIVILSDLQGTWVESNRSPEFAHSIVGIIGTFIMKSYPFLLCV